MLSFMGNKRAGISGQKKKKKIQEKVVWYRYMPLSPGSRGRGR